ncbi:MFS transporter, PPP family, 3-phenylpropionic acid transporter [Atopostipes suicloacalis DSM 15692]|uniref:MFS transporter, PPP family, 3-phenylpropionic acid transporter n=1 Tax=Atopostipes suicloacalis DSM 15692 TaxID=1121025 RepID=A0A1M4Z0K5_9LACT|nr:MFS transporter [Atopostipes suicloacalis]SHF11357.1 MFS transporter, PPP family, 3-phenylpropionic acid transporter [Atopostipes suicloacalis DSM 15692]
MTRQLNIKYIASQFFYFSMFASMFAFVSVYLLHKGFDNATIGTVLSIMSLSTIGIQTLLANYIDKNKEIRLQDVISFLALGVVVGSIVLYFMPIELAILILIVLLLAIAQCLLTFVNSLAFIYEKFGIHINYGVARGMGSFAYAIMTMVLGQVVKATTPDILPLFYSAFALLLLLSVRSYSLPKTHKVIVEDERVEESIAEQVAVEQSIFSFFLKYSRLVLLMGGVVFLFFAHTIINNFFIQVITPIGGDSGVMGTAVFVAAIVELPAMMNFEQLSRKISIDRLLKISAVFFLAKHALTYLAPNMFVIYLAQFLQIGAYSVVYPALVEYIKLNVDLEDLVKGQSLLTTAIALSSVFASFLGGILLDTVGVSQTLFIGVITTIIGLAIVFVTVENPQKHKIQTEKYNKKMGL